MSRANKLLAAAAASSVGVTLSLTSLPASAEISFPASSPMSLGSAAFAPRGYLKFCERRPDQCGLPAPIAQEDRAALERDLNQQQWANVLNLKPTSIGRPETPSVAPPAIASAPLILDTVSLQEPGLTSQLQPDLPQVVLDKDGPLSIVDLEPIEVQTVAPLNIEIAQAAPLFLTVPSPLPIPEPDTPKSEPLLSLSPTVWAMLDAVNQSIYARIRPMSDGDASREADYWTLPLSDEQRPVGDCKDYALEKRKALVDAGVSPNVLSLAVVQTGWGEIHAVLIVGTDQGDYVLDNLSPWIKGWQDSHYTWIERQTPGEPLRWATVRPQTAS